MKFTPRVERLIYALVVALALLALLLVACVPGNFLNVRPVYQGF